MSDPTGPGPQGPAPTPVAGGPGRSRRPVRPPRRRDRSIRVPAIAGVAALLAAGGLADRGGSSAPASPPGPAAAGEAVPVAAPAAAISSSWFCGGATDNPGGSAPGSVVIADAGSGALSATVRLVAEHGAGATRTVKVPAGGAVAVPETLPSHPAWIAAIVDVDRGDAAVSQRIDGPLGKAASPCATSGSDQWYFPSGATLVNASDVLTLVNPYPTDAVVDLSFTTDQGIESPGDFQGLDVPPGRMITVDLRSHLRRRRQIATTVHARSGRVVAWSTEVVTPPAKGEAVIGAKDNPSNPTSADPASPVPGVTLTLGASSPGTSWAWPDGNTGGGLSEGYVVYNPTGRTAALQLSVSLDQGSAQPFELTVGPQAVTTISSDTQARIPPGVGHAATLRSVNGVPVVAARTLSGAAPSSHRGLGTLIGERVAAPDWLVPDGVVKSTSDDVALLDPGRNPLDATVYAFESGRLVPVPGLVNLTLAPGRRSVHDLSGALPGYSGPVEVKASGPIEVESDLFGTGSTPGISLAPGVPLS